MVLTPDHFHIGKVSDLFKMIGSFDVVSVEIVLHHVVNDLCLGFC